MKPTITLSIDLGWGRPPMSITREISDDLIRRCYRPLDHPSENAGIARVFCTDPGTLEATVRIRRDAAKMIAELLTVELLESMTRGDTLMGYPIERNAVISSK